VPTVQQQVTPNLLYLSLSNTHTRARSLFISLSLSLSLSLMPASASAAASAQQVTGESASAGALHRTPYTLQVRARLQGHPHTLAPSHPHTLTPPHPHTLTTSHPHTLTPSHPHTLLQRSYSFGTSRCARRGCRVLPMTNTLSSRTCNLPPQSSKPSTSDPTPRILSPRPCMVQSAAWCRAAGSRRG